jgi:hypothetical protein
MRSGQLRPLLLGTARTLPWRSLFCAVGAVASLTAVTHATRNATATRGLLPVAAVILAGAAGSAIGDESRDLQHSVPTPWRVRGGLRVLAGGLLAALAWLGLAAYVALVAGGVHVAEWGLRLAALTAVALACSLRWGGTAALGSMLVTLVTVVKLPVRWRMLVGFDDPGYAAAQARWALLLAIAATGVCVALRDPARPPLLARGRPVLR